DERWHALFTDEERAVIAAHVPWTRMLADVRTTVDGADVDLLDYVRRHRDVLVIKPNDEYGGHGVTLGGETTEQAWDDLIARVLQGPPGSWIVQQRIAIRREVFPYVETPHNVVFKNMLVDFAPYIFRGQVAGFLTRLSASGLANVTSGGGQVPSF